MHRLVAGSASNSLPEVVRYILNWFANNIVNILRVAHNSPANVPRAPPIALDTF